MQETDENRALTNYTTGTNHTKTSLFDRPFVKGFLYSWVLFATCLTVSDGLLTPVRSWADSQPNHLLTWPSRPFRS